MWQFSGNVLCFVEGCLLGDEKALYRYAEEQWHFKFHRPQALYAALAEEYYINHLHSTRASALIHIFNIILSLQVH